MPRPESSRRRVHLVGIAGTGMGSLAGLYRAAGWEVRGSDQAIYPPMSGQLAELGIEVFDGYDPGHLSWRPDQVVIGNIARADNPEASAAARLGLRCRSMAAALAEVFLTGRHAVVVAGTHGKTTTAAALARALDVAGRDPSFLVGGVLRDLDTTFRLGSGDLFVIEGDEYETAFFDRNPKFLHYQPRTALLTSIEFDHAEVFRDLDAVRSAFHRFLALLPPHGRLVVCADDREARAAAAHSPAPVSFYGLDEGPGTRARLLEAGTDGMVFEVRRGGSPYGVLRSPLTGEHNLRNLTGALEVLAGLGLEAGAIGAGLAAFRGVRRRQEVRGTARGVTVVDDFAHHPTAVRETLRALRQRFGRRRLIALFEPRTNSSRRAVFQQAYAEAFDTADRVVVTAVDHPELAPAGDRFDPERLIGDLRGRGLPAVYLPSVTAVVDELAATCRPGDVIVAMSNGAFGNVHARLLDALGRGAGQFEAAPPA